ncbi:hypothetical protein ACWDKQ_19085 [Saccharopolyspora sp. NPDC000995]
MTQKAQQFLVETEQSFDDTVKDYNDTEQQIIELLNNAGKELAGWRGLGRSPGEGFDRRQGPSCPAVHARCTWSPG